MKDILLLFIMIFLHIFADFNLQGVLASMKQKKWWARKFVNQSEFDRSKYKNDYKAALLAHSFEWAFIVTIPLLRKAYLYSNNWIYTLQYVILLSVNVYWHFVIDNDKANNHKLNLIEDQILHLLQIGFTWFLSIVVT